jgi:dipeptidyl aminopeptidase/acylaminoacyl peptidase
MEPKEQSMTLVETRTETVTASWRDRFRARKVIWTHVAQTRPERGLAASDRPGKMELHAWDLVTGELRQLTDRPAGTLFGQISPDGSHVYFLDDVGGNEAGHFVRIPWEGGNSEDVTPELPPYSSFGADISRSGNLFAATLIDEAGYGLIAINLDPAGGLGEARLLHRDKRLFTPPVVSPDGEIAVVGSTERTGRQHFNLVAFHTRSGERVGELWDGDAASLHAGPFAPETLQLAGTTNRSGHEHPLVWSPRSGERRDLDVGDLDGDVVPLDWSADGNRLLLMQTSRATQRLHIYDLQTDTLRSLDHPSGSYGFYGGTGVYFGAKDEIVAQWTDSTHPSQVIALDGVTGQQTRTLLPAGETPASRPLRSVAFSSSDGQDIQGWLGLPEGKGPFPTILHTHGGPEAVATQTFSPDAQAWLDHGFAFLTINYRGSITFGRDFQQQIWGNLGHWELEDMVAARDWLVREGIADSARIFPSGRSYGGYLTLLALGKRPDLWAGGMAGVAISDWTMLYEDSPETRGYCAAIFGGTPDERPDQYVASSPITYAEAIRAPLLILQERHDARTPARPIEVYAERLQELGKDLELHWFETGHMGAVNAEQGIAYLELMLDFAQRVLGRAR